MGYGLVFKNNSGSITVDGMYKNMDLLRVEQAPVGLALRWSLPKPGVTCVYSPAGYVLAHAYAGNNTAPFFEGSQVFSSAGSGQLIHFQTQPIQSAPYGINVRNPNTGELVFSSRVKPMRVVDAISGTHDMADDSLIYTRQFDPARKYAVALGNIPSRVDARGSYSPSVGTKITCANGGVKIEAGVIGSTGSGAFRGNIRTPVYNFLIVDVTGYV